MVIVVCVYLNKVLVVYGVFEAMVNKIDVSVLMMSLGIFRVSYNHKECDVFYRWDLKVDFERFFLMV